MTTRPTFAEALCFWLKLGWVSFGGPAGQIALMHAELVEKRRWMKESQFLHALNYCMVLPGPEAQQLAIYSGWLLHGIRGGVAAGLLFILPSMGILWALSWLYMAGGQVPWIAAIFYGLQPAVLAIVAAAVLRMSRKTLKTPLAAGLAIVAFLAICVGKLPFVGIIAAAAILGAGAARFFPALLPVGGTDDPVDGERTEVAGWGRFLGVLAIGMALWALPLGAAMVLQGSNGIFLQQGLFFSKTALVTFGGAYAVLPYVAQETVGRFGWLSTEQMMAGLALAETTPGPLIMVLQFVGFVAAWQHPGALTPLAAGTLGAAITTWVTFLPSFLFILAGAPYVEGLRRVRALSAALAAITSAVVGIMANLAVWFAWHLLWPEGGGFDGFALALAVVFFGGMVKGGWGAIPVVAAGALLGLVGKGVLGW